MYDLKRHYGISIEGYELLLEDQDFCCAVCKGRITSDSACVDHDHITKQVRGLLCSSCNLGLGHLKDDYEVVLAAANYLIQTGDGITREAQGTKAKSRTQ